MSCSNCKKKKEDVFKAADRKTKSAVLVLIIMTGFAIYGFISLISKIL